MIAAGGSDGCVTWINGARAATRARKAVRISQMVKEYMMLMIHRREFRNKRYTDSIIAVSLGYIV